MLSTTFWHDIKWALLLAALSLLTGLLWQWPLVQQSWQGELFSQIKDLERQEAARRLEGVRTLNLQQAYERHQQGETLFIDARSPAEFMELHIDGAINLTPEQARSRALPENLKNSVPDRTIIVYCGHADCHASLQVAEFLQSYGFTQVAVFVGGFRIWDEAGYPVDIVH